MEEPTIVISEYLYASEGKTYKPDEVNPLLQQMIGNLTTVLAVFKAECADAFFIKKVVEAITQIMAAYSYHTLVSSL